MGLFGADDLDGGGASVPVQARVDAFSAAGSEGATIRWGSSAEG
ncbi:hypothetical protein B005_1682 [Nocardiopsis alba ATCC BAA-2165]|uniref:Uncharacterized protein n=1 Tax=Nocardiopsis alba (strain ATCC BAA-2165 / BE74) TaxID=1205910 RepID=J7L4W9_NOCAA|nr:hypothetical protein B005_1682 [Nocardiopsis alba ATCC BAA-2165]